MVAHGDAFLPRDQSSQSETASLLLLCIAFEQGAMNPTFSNVFLQSICRFARPKLNGRMSRKVGAQVET